MAATGVTIVFTRINKSGRPEPLMNRAAAWVTGSEFAHIELAIGHREARRGAMTNVLRIFNDSTGVELAERMGTNPAFCYMDLWCSSDAEQRMLRWAKAQVGKPFSAVGMVRSVIWPRVSDGSSWFCAELVAAALKVGGIIQADYNTGAATPASLYKMFHSRCATTGNPVVLRRLQASYTHDTACSTACAKHTEPRTEEAAPLLGGGRQQTAEHAKRKQMAFAARLAATLPRCTSKAARQHGSSLYLTPMSLKQMHQR